MSTPIPVDELPVGVPVLPKRKRKRRVKRKPKHMPRYNVVLWNDDEHTFEYVIFMMRDLFGHTKELGRKIAVTVHLQGRAVVYTSHLELAELKRDQILAYGADKFVNDCKGSMGATVEKVEE